MKNNTYVKQILDLNEKIENRRELHKAVAPILQTMGTDKSFWEEVFKRNLNDKGFLDYKWSMYDIPFLYVYECDDFYLKIHLFTALESKEKNILASAIHHHNNYLLTSFAAFGSGYETFIFDREPKFNKETKEVQLKIRERFKQKDRKVHMVDSWEPHAVINPETLSATLVFWSPETKLATDKLRSNPFLKAVKKPLRQLIYLLGMDRKLGIAAKETYQWYPHKDKFYGILEDEFFAPTKTQVGPDVNNYSIQTVFYFMQKMGFTDKAYFEKLKADKNTPAYYLPWIDKILANEPIPETYAKSEINIPGKRITAEEVERVNKLTNG